MSDQTTSSPDAEQKTSGVLIRGADGALYFIPHDQLQPFRVPEKGTQVMEDMLKSTQATNPADATHAAIPTHWPLVGLCGFGEFANKSDG